MWASGYQSDYSWINVPVFDEGGGVAHDTIAASRMRPELYFLGLQWQYTRSSGHLVLVSSVACRIGGRSALAQPTVRLR